MKAMGQVVALHDVGDFVEVTVLVKVEKGHRAGAKAEFQVSVAPHERRSYWIGRKVKFQMGPVGK